MERVDGEQRVEARPRSRSPRRPRGRRRRPGPRRGRARRPAASTPAAAGSVQRASRMRPSRGTRRTRPPAADSSPAVGEERLQERRRTPSPAPRPRPRAGGSAGGRAARPTASPPPRSAAPTAPNTTRVDPGQPDRARAHGARLDGDGERAAVQPPLARAPRPRRAGRGSRRARWGRAAPRGRCRRRPARAPSASTTTAPIGTSPVRGAARGDRRGPPVRRVGDGSSVDREPRHRSSTTSASCVGEPAAAADRGQLLVGVELELAGQHLAARRRAGRGRRGSPGRPRASGSSATSSSAGARRAAGRGRRRRRRSRARRRRRRPSAPPRPGWAAAARRTRRRHRAGRARRPWSAATRSSVIAASRSTSASAAMRAQRQRPSSRIAATAYPGRAVSRTSAGASTLCTAMPSTVGLLPTVVQTTTRS